jgi:ankyrin repeat protein
MVVTENGDIERVKKLIGSGSNINARSIDCEFRIHGSAREDKTALMFAAEKGHVEIARLLIEHGADITAEDTMRGPAWMYAVENGHLEILKLLWEKGAEIIDRHWIISSLYLSCRNRRPDIVEFLAGKIDNPAHLSFPLTCAIQNKDNASAHVLLAHGAQIRADAILAAAFNGDKGILKYFSEIGVSPDMRMNHLGVGVDDATPLMLAAQRGDTTAAALLLEMGANVGAVDAKGWTPLDYAKNGYSLGAKDEAFLKRRQPIIKLLESSKSTPVH